MLEPQQVRTDAPGLVAHITLPRAQEGVRFLPQVGCSTVFSDKTKYTFSC